MHARPMHATGWWLRSCLATLCLLIAASISSFASAQSAQNPEQSPISAEFSTAFEQLNQAIAAGQHEKAIALARRLDDQKPTEIDLSLSLVQLARSLQASGETAGASEFYTRTCDALTRPASANLAAETVISMRLMAATWFVQTEERSIAAVSLERAFERADAFSELQRKIAVDLCLTLGADSLQSGLPEIASVVYPLAVKHASDQQRSLAMLGDAWAMAMLGKQPIEAANRMTDFVNAFPKHPDAPRALRAAVACLKQYSANTDKANTDKGNAEKGDFAAAPLDKSEQENRILTDLLTRWPDLIEAKEITANYVGRRADQIPMSVQNWIVSQAKTDQIDALDPPMIVLALQIAATHSDSTCWDRCKAKLGEIDQTGQWTSDLLDRLASKSDAEQFVIYLLTSSSEMGNTKDRFEPASAADSVSGPKRAICPMAREAACRWAGRNQNWSMLAMAASSTSPETNDPTRTVAMERLFAESLMQTGHKAAAHAWWVHLVDMRKVDDFATLLRCAETESSLGEVGVASRRVDAAKQAAGDDQLRGCLVSMLAAELAVRRLRFDEARGELEAVVRSSTVDASLRGRAQWMIGETFYLQERFTDAIEAYRSVAGMDPDGVWVAAALVQAGKCFEQLGRTRDAAVCYSTLMARHRDSQYAELASRRLAALSNATSSDSNKTLRR
ncbi:tetratricopeptide repeat protein [Novipirellula aureliae]|uniref:tetratricopeptide repeat protein n=1 Tax=Novipirellula aureliae TaxID=2527966 RepID=UPI001E5180FC|nr:tetratricopeptide repeat protein [Novipirellula aureliae]